MARLGREAPRVFTPPLRELTPETTLGYEVAEFARDVMGIDLLPWQRWLLVHALEIVDLPGGTWRFRYRTVIVLVGRQNGKTLLGRVLATYFLYVLRVGLIIGTAQDISNAEDVWEEVVETAEAIPELADQIRHVWRTNGSKRLQLSGGRDYRVRATNRRAGRGKSADLVLLDELREHQTWDAYAALSKTGMARRSALLWCMSNAGDGTSVVLRHFRARAHAAVGDPDGVAAALAGSEPEPDPDADVMADTALGIFEWSADPGAAVRDRDAWAQANPSMGYLIDEATLSAASVDDPEDVFRTECLCQWVTASVDPPFPVGAWEAGRDESSEIAPDSPVWYGVDVSEDRARTAIAVCGMRADRDWHVELADMRPGVGWVPSWFQAEAARGPVRVAMQTHGAPVASMAEIIGAVEGVEIVECRGPDVAGWCGRFWDAVAAGDPAREGPPDVARVWHRTQPALDLAANVAATRPLGDGAWAWDRKRSLEDVAPLVAVTMAYGAATSVAEPEPEVASAYEDRGLLLV